MPTSEINWFVAWAKQASPGRGLMCHFYITESTKQYYDNADFAYFNLSSGSPDLIVKGTTGHGIKSKRRKSSPIPCLDCFAINKEFYDALRALSHGQKRRFQLGLVLNRRILSKQFNLIKVSTEYPSPRPPPEKCHYCDIPYKRPGALSPFNYCDAVRIEITRSRIGREPITEIPLEAILAMLTKPENGEWVSSQLELKGMTEVMLFCPLQSLETLHRRIRKTQDMKCLFQNNVMNPFELLETICSNLSTSQIPSVEDPGFW